MDLFSGVVVAAVTTARAFEGMVGEASGPVERAREEDRVETILLSALGLRIWVGSRCEGIVEEEALARYGPSSL